MKKYKILFVFLSLFVLNIMSVSAHNEMVEEKIIDGTRYKLNFKYSVIDYDDFLEINKEYLENLILPHTKIDVSYFFNKESKRVVNPGIASTKRLYKLKIKEEGKNKIFEKKDPTFIQGVRYSNGANKTFLDKAEFDLNNNEIYFCRGGKYWASGFEFDSNYALFDFFFSIPEKTAENEYTIHRILIKDDVINYVYNKGVNELLEDRYFTGAFKKFGIVLYREDDGKIDIEKSFVTSFLLNNKAIFDFLSKEEPLPGSYSGKYGYTKNDIKNVSEVKNKKISLYSSDLLFKERVEEQVSYIVVDIERGHSLDYEDFNGMKIGGIYYYCRDKEFLRKMFVNFKNEFSTKEIGYNPLFNDYKSDYLIDFEDIEDYFVDYIKYNKENDIYYKYVDEDIPDSDNKIYKNFKNFYYLRMSAFSRYFDKIKDYQFILKHVVDDYSNKVGIIFQNDADDNIDISKLNKATKSRELFDELTFLNQGDLKKRKFTYTEKIPLTTKEKFIITNYLNMKNGNMTIKDIFDLSLIKSFFDEVVFENLEEYQNNVEKDYELDDLGLSKYLDKSLDIMDPYIEWYIRFNASDNNFEIERKYKGDVNERKYFLVNQDKSLTEINLDGNNSEKYNIVSFIEDPNNVVYYFLVDKNMIKTFPLMVTKNNGKYKISDNFSNLLIGNKNYDDLIIDNFDTPFYLNIDGLQGFVKKNKNMKEMMSPDYDLPDDTDYSSLVIRYAKKGLFPVLKAFLGSSFNNLENEEIFYAKNHIDFYANFLLSDKTNLLKYYRPNFGGFSDFSDRIYRDEAENIPNILMGPMSGDMSLPTSVFPNTLLTTNMFVEEWLEDGYIKATGFLSKIILDEVLYSNAINNDFMDKVLEAINSEVSYENYDLDYMKNSILAVKNELIKKFIKTPKDMGNIFMSFVKTDSIPSQIERLLRVEVKELKQNEFELSLNLNRTVLKGISQKIKQSSALWKGFDANIDDRNLGIYFPLEEYLGSTLKGFNRTKTFVDLEHKIDKDLLNLFISLNWSIDYLTKNKEELGLSDSFASPSQNFVVNMIPQDFIDGINVKDLKIHKKYIFSPEYHVTKTDVYHLLETGEFHPLTEEGYQKRLEMMKFDWVPKFKVLEVERDEANTDLIDLTQAIENMVENSKITYIDKIYYNSLGGTYNPQVLIQIPNGKEYIITIPLHLKDTKNLSHNSTGDDNSEPEIEYEYYDEYVYVDVPKKDKPVMNSTQSKTWLQNEIKKNIDINSSLKIKDLILLVAKYSFEDFRSVKDVYQYAQDLSIKSKLITKDFVKYPEKLVSSHDLIEILRNAPIKSSKPIIDLIKSKKYNLTIKEILEIVEKSFKRK